MVKRNLDDIIRSKLIDEIITGSWIPGSLINVDAIMDKYEVSRTPVIQALKKMNANGLVDFTSKGHYYVPDFNRDDVRNIIDVRFLLEDFALQKIINSPEPVDLSRLEQLCDQGQSSSDDGDVTQVRRSDLNFHRELVELSGNNCLYDAFIRVQDKFMIANYLIGRHTALQQQVANADHFELVQFIKAGNYPEASRMLRDHIEGAYRKIMSREEAAQA